MGSVKEIFNQPFSEPRPRWPSAHFRQARKLPLPDLCLSGTLSPRYIFGRFCSLRRPPFRAQKMVKNCTIFVQSKSFRCNTSEPSPMCCKQRTCAISKSFRCNTYEKHRGVGGTPSFGPLCTCLLVIENRPLRSADAF